MSIFVSLLRGLVRRDSSLSPALFSGACALPLPGELEGSPSVTASGALMGARVVRRGRPPAARDSAAMVLMNDAQLLGRPYYSRSVIPTIERRWSSYPSLAQIPSTMTACEA